MREAKALNDIEKIFEPHLTKFYSVEKFEYDSFADSEHFAFSVKKNHVIGIYIKEDKNCLDCYYDLRSRGKNFPPRRQCKNCGIRYLPKSLGMLEFLEDFYLEVHTDFKHGFDKLPDSFFNLKNLKNLYITNKRLKTSSENICNMKSLEKFTFNKKSVL